MLSWKSDYSGTIAMMPYFIVGMLAIFSLTLATFAWILWRDERRQDLRTHTAEYIKDIATTCQQIATSCEDEKTKVQLESLNLDLTRKVALLNPGIVDGRPRPEFVTREPVERWSASLEASLMLVAESTVILLAVDYMLGLKPVSVALLYVVPIVFAAARYGFIAATLGLVAASLLAAFMFFPPRFSLRVADPQELLHLIIFFAIGLAAIQIITTYSNRSVQR